MIIDYNLPTLNEYINAERTNKYIAAKIKKKATETVCWIAKSLNIQKFDVCIDIDFIWYLNNNKIDHDNICFAKKFVLDGLIMAGVIKDDNYKFVGNFTDSFILDKSLKNRACQVIFKK